MASLIKLVRTNPISSLKTIFICLAFMSVGFQSGILGPSLLDFKIQTGSESLSEVTWIVTGRGIGFAFGSALCGSLEPLINLQLLMAIALTFSGIMYFIIPFTNYLWLSITGASLAGIFQGIIDTGSNVLVLKIWASDCPPFLQAVFSSYGTGSLISPLIVRPFLYDQEHSLSITTNSTNMTDIDENLSRPTPEDIDLLNPFLFTTFFPWVIAAAFFFLYCKHPKSELRQSPPSREEILSKPTFGRQMSSTSMKYQNQKLRNESHMNTITEGEPTTSNGISTISRAMSVVSESAKSKKSIREAWTPMKLVVISLVSVIALFLCGVEQTVGTYAPAFAVQSSLKLSEANGATSSSIFWLSLTGFQLISIPFTSWVGVEITILVNIINSILASVLYLYSTSHVIIYYVATAYLGASYASQWGAIFAYLECRFIVNGVIVSWLTITSCVGQSVFVLLIGNLMDHDTDSLLWFALSCSLIMAVIFVLTYFICLKYFPKKQ